MQSAEYPFVYKPLQSGKRGETELAFYELVARRPAREPARFLPAYHGIAAGPSLKTESPQYFLVLEDLARPFVRPSMLDVKVGVQTWGEDAPPEKAAAERSKFPLQQAAGFRVTGMRVWQPVAQAYREHGRAFGYGLTEPRLHDAFREYLYDGVRVRTELIPPLLARLRDIEAWFESQAEFRFYGSSLLFLYEGEGGGAAVDVRMIDFAHVWPIRDGGRDSGYSVGLARIIRCLEQLASEEAADVRDHALTRSPLAPAGTDGPS